MHLPAMMDVVQEEMRKQVADPLRYDACLAAICRDTPVQVGIRQAVAKGDQLAVEPGLRLGEFPRLLIWLETRSDGAPHAALFQHVEIEEIDQKDVVQRFPDRREETRPFRLELAVAQSQNRAI